MYSYLFSAPNEILILILSQPDAYHNGLAKNLYDNITHQSSHLNSTNPINVKILHEIVDQPGYWTFLAILPHLEEQQRIGPNIKWVVLCEDQSVIDLKLLLDGLEEWNWKQARIRLMSKLAQN